MAIIVAAIGVVLAAVIRFRRWLAPPVRRYAALYGARAAVAAGAIALAAAGSATAGRVAQPVVVASHAVAAAPTDRTTQAAPSAVWQRVSTVETAVADLQTRLAIVASEAQASTADSRLAPTRGAAASVNPAAAQQAISVQLENALQSEYAVFVAAAQDPAQRQSLISDSEAATGGARDAVLYNLSAVTTQLAQEAAIARAQPPAALSTGSAPAALTLPLAGALTQPFGPSSFALEPPITFGGVTYPHFHTGIDIAAPIDSPIVAAADGVVVIAGSSVDSAGKLVGYGNYIVIAHPGRMITLYGHLDRLLVQAGQTVKAGQVIGLEGATGNATGPHLHFEVRIAGLLVDPMRYLASHFRTA